MDEWFSNYAPFYYWPESWWPRFEAGTGPKTIHVAGHQVAFSYGTATASTLSLRPAAGWGWRPIFIQVVKPRPPRRRLYAEPTISAFESGRQTLRQARKLKPSPKWKNEEEEIVVLLMAMALAD